MSAADDQWHSTDTVRKERDRFVAFAFAAADVLIELDAGFRVRFVSGATAALTARAIPALVLKGACDYQTWSSAVEYVQTLPEARLVYLLGAGHNAYHDKPDRYLAVVTAFLLDHPLPEPLYQGTHPPDDYEGPP